TQKLTNRERSSVFGFHRCLLISIMLTYERAECVIQVLRCAIFPAIQVAIQLREMDRFLAHHCVVIG
ncbi:MAG TPA: hypothetical protein VHZ51_01230, partial [Ktedonobacteraceae bacterium]|nr:hypothetical protein [Ktedonobacteraceae bacterium]